MGNKSFDEKFYFHQATNCFTKALPGLRDCLGKVHSQLFEGIRLWTVMLPYRDPSDRTIDCEYKIHQKYFKIHNISAFKNMFLCSI